MIHINGLQKIIGTQTLLDIEKFEVPGGDIVAVVGPTGSGKTLLMDLLIGRNRPTMGEIRIGNVHHISPEALSQNIGVLFEENGLFPRQSAMENLKFHCRLFNIPAARAIEVLEMVGLQEHHKTRSEDLSSGFARRLAFGRALLHQPEILVLVEPFARCDEASIKIISKIIQQQKELGNAVLILSADETRLDQLCNQIFRLNQGKLNLVEKEASVPENLYPFKIPVRLEGKVVLLNPVDILFIDADEGKTQIWTSNGPLQSQFTLGELEQRLARSGFFRAHRSYLVNLQHVREVIRYTRNSFSLRLNDSSGTKIPLSKSGAAELRELLDY